MATLSVGTGVYDTAVNLPRASPQSPDLGIWQSWHLVVSEMPGGGSHSRLLLHA